MLLCGCRRGKGALRFELDGEDLTKADKRLTDAEIARHFPLDLFERAVFYGQTDVSALLEVSVTWSDAGQLMSRILYLTSGGLPCAAHGKSALPLPCPCACTVMVMTRIQGPRHLC